MPAWSHPENGKYNAFWVFNSVIKLLSEHAKKIRATENTPKGVANRRTVYPERPNLEKKQPAHYLEVPNLEHRASVKITLHFYKRIVYAPSFSESIFHAT